MLTRPQLFSFGCEEILPSTAIRGDPLSCSEINDRAGYRDWRAKINVVILSKCEGLLISTNDGSSASLIAAYTGLSQAKNAK